MHQLRTRLQVRAVGEQRVGFGFYALSVALALAGSACGAHSSSGDSGSETGSGSAETSAPDTVEVKGRTFIRRDLLSAEEIERWNYEGRWDQPSTDVNVYAAQLRGHLLHQGVYYIEAQPNLALAARILKGEPTPIVEPGVPLEGRTVVGPDNRTHTSAHTSFPQSAMAFNNSRGSGLKISAHTLYTAAHVVFDTYGDSNTIPVTKPDGFFCANGKTSASKACTTLPSWILGLEGTSGVSGWITPNCLDMTVPGAYVSFTAAQSSDLFGQARWDYVSIGMTDSCNLGPANNWFGTNVNASLLSGGPLSSLGYAEWATCADNQGGANQADCTGGSWQLSPGANTSGPFNSAKLWYQTGIPDVLAGVAQPTYTFSTRGDVTHGNSGGPVYNVSNFALGVCSRQHFSTTVPPTYAQEYNVYQRWNSETYNFFFDNSPFPG